MFPRHVLMSYPNGYRIESAINPHMRDTAGRLKVVDFAKALAEWDALRELYGELGLTVHTIEAKPEWPDMVFCANQTFPFLDSNEKPAVVLSRMRSPTRSGEVPLFEKWARENGLRVHVLKGQGGFEGSGDAIWDFDAMKIYGGYGFRTDFSVYDELEALVKCDIVRLELRDERFYHLDTCFLALGQGRAAYVEEAFAPAGLASLRTHLKDLIRIPLGEALECFAGNAFCPDGRNVILQAGTRTFVSQLKERGLVVHEVETGEYLKAGGSVFCMKQQLWLKTSTI
jgi:N-dimethylarginine dimethylaminohydrolase